jgi:hypothetical protein
LGSFIKSFLKLAFNMPSPKRFKKQELKPIKEALANST